ncbi:MAG: hypothetical protein GX303_04740 [Clostridiales bacterium]|nr:hypothetical protein [Clostridiales bacterium]
MKLTEKTAYLKGLCEGLNLDEQKPEAKLIKEIIALLEDMAITVADLEDECEVLNDYIEEIDEDLGVVEEYLLDDEEDDDYDCCCDDDCFELVCPSCGDTICFDGDIDFDNLVCPACNERFDCECDDDSCSCKASEED